MQAILLGLLALWVSGPFLLPDHTQPIPSFWNEWWAVLLGLAASIAGLLSWRNRSVALPRIIILPAALLGMVLLQYLLGALPFTDIGLLHAGYLMWAALLMVLGRHLAEHAGIESIADVLSTGILLGSLLESGVALAQWLGLAHSLPGIFDQNGTIGANLGQANHLSHYCWLGIASALLLHARNHLSRLPFWISVILLMLSSTLSGSRSPILYALAALFLLGYASHRHTDPRFRSLRFTAALLLPVLLTMNLLVETIGPLIAASTTTSAERAFALVTGPSIRIHLAHTAWLAFLDSPWLGQGAGGFTWASFTIAAAGNDGSAFQVAEHAHNLILNLLVEFGAPITLIALMILILWVKHFLKQAWGLQHIWCASILCIGLIHGFLEYPYWYTYFLGPSALLLGMFDRQETVQIQGGRFSIYLLLIAAGGLAALVNMRQDYQNIEQISYRPLSFHAEREQSWHLAMNRLTELHRGSLLAPWAVLALANLAEPSDSLVQERSSLCEKALRLSPARRLVTRCAVQMFLAGRREEGERLWLSALQAFPKEREHSLNELEAWAKEFPALIAWAKSNRVAP